MDTDVLSRIDPRGLHRLNNSRDNRRVCDAAAAAMIKGQRLAFLCRERISDVQGALFPCLSKILKGRETEK